MTWLMEILKICLEEHSDKMLCDKAFKIAKIPKYDGYLIQWFINCLIKKLLEVVLKVKLYQTKS